MKLGDVERLEVVVRRFDFRALDDGKADGKENVFDFLEDLADQVMRANGADDSRERKIYPLSRKSGLFCAGFDGEAAGFNLRFDVRAQFIERSADSAFEMRLCWFQPVVCDLLKDSGLPT